MNQALKSKKKIQNTQQKEKIFLILMYFYMYKGISETQKNDYLRSLVIAIGV